MNYDSTDSRSIPPLQDLICDNKEKAKICNDFFCNQSDLDDTNILTPNIFLRKQGSLGHIIITENEVEDILKILDIFKASGPDAGSPRLLKATQILRHPFVDFLIYLLELEYFLLIGNVPTSLPFSKKIPQVTITITDLYL